MCICSRRRKTRRYRPDDPRKVVRFGFRKCWNLRPDNLRLDNDWCDETVANSRYRLNELRLSRIVPQRLALLSNRRIDPVLGVDEYLARPEPLCDLRSAHQLAFP